MHDSGKKSESYLDAVARENDAMRQIGCPKCGPRCPYCGVRLTELVEYLKTFDGEEQQDSGNKVRPERKEKETILEEASELVDGDRQEDYGHPIDNHTRTAKMWSALLGVEVTAEQVCLCMVALKLSRQCHKPKRDNLVDGCGYLRNVEMIEEAREHDEIDEEVRERKGKPKLKQPADK